MGQESYSSVDIGSKYHTALSRYLSMIRLVENYRMHTDDHCITACCLFFPLL